MMNKITETQARSMRAVALETPERPTCPRCGRRMVHHQVVLTGSGGHKRQVWKCQGCGQTTRTAITEKGG